MTTQPAAPSAPAVPLKPRAVQITAAEHELGAFLSAVRQKFGAEAAQRAGTYWIEALEAAQQPSPDWRDITIAAASRLAKDRQTT